METRQAAHNIFILTILIICLILLSTTHLAAQIFTPLHDFTGKGVDGATPESTVLLSSNTFYGTTMYGGGAAFTGTIFSVNADGTGYHNLHAFSRISALDDYINADGAQPVTGLAISSNTLYGTTYIGGSSGGGTVFKLNTDGSGFTNLHSFTWPVNVKYEDGALPATTLKLSGDTLYGATVQGGAQSAGTVFKLNTDGTGFKILHDFTNADGAAPIGAMVLADNTLYGVTRDGGTSGYGK